MRIEMISILGIISFVLRVLFLKSIERVKQKEKEIIRRQKRKKTNNRVSIWNHN